MPAATDVDVMVLGAAAVNCRAAAAAEALLSNDVFISILALLLLVRYQQIRSIKVR